MRMPDGDNRMAAVKVQVFLSFVVPHRAALRPYGRNIEEGIYVKKVHTVC